MADVFRITIVRLTQGRTRKGVKPEVHEKVVYTQEIDNEQYARAVRAVNSVAKSYEEDLFPKEPK